MLGLPWDWQSPNRVPWAMSCSFCPLAGECLGSDEQIFTPKVLWALPALSMAGQLHPWRWTWLNPLRTDCPGNICDSPTLPVCPTAAAGVNCPGGFSLIHSHRSTGLTPVRTLKSSVQELLQMGLVTREAECCSCLWLKLDFQQIQII